MLTEFMAGLRKGLRIRDRVRVTDTGLEVLPCMG